MILRAFFLTTALFSILLAACSGESAPVLVSGGRPGPGLPIPMPPVPEPTEHRATATPCTEERPPGSGGSGDPEDECTSDADCTEGDNGRCVGGLSAPAFCSYDECTTDADCGTVRACACRAGPKYEANTCLNGTCRVDADCGQDGFCSPSGITLSPSCLTGIALGSVGFFCRTTADECFDDAECKLGNRCLFSASAKHWRCQEILCTN